MVSKPVLAGLIVLAVLALWTFYGVYVSMTTPEPDYTVIESLEDNVEIRHYSPQIWASVIAEDQNKAFNLLFRYISGNNDRKEKIEMTAPVITRAEEDGLYMAFVMPERFDQKSIPQPLSEDLKIEAIEERKLATITFSWYANEKTYQNKLDVLMKTLDENQISTMELPMLMQYNDPWTPPFARRNEVALMVN